MQLSIIKNTINLFFIPVFFLQDVEEEPANLNYDEIFQDKVNSWGLMWLQEKKGLSDFKKQKHFKLMMNQDSLYKAQLENSMWLQGHWERNMCGKKDCLWRSSIIMSCVHKFVFFLYAVIRTY